MTDLLQIPFGLDGTLFGSSRSRSRPASTPAYIPAGTLIGDELSPPIAQWRVDVGSFASPWMQSFERDVNRLATLRGNWDTYGGVPLQEKAVLNALKLLSSLGFDGPAPSLSPTPDGGLHLEWNHHGVEISLDIDDSGSLEVILERDGVLSEWTTTTSGRGDGRLVDALAQITGACRA